ncbi:MAG: hypothetical protein ACYCO9_09225 [Streptosporangiaceae bacterium]
MSGAPVSGDAYGGSVESVYPFIYSGTTDLSAVLDQAPASTIAKVVEIRDLRARICAEEAARLSECARQAAERFDAGGRHGLMTIGLAGYEGGKMAELDSLDYLFVALSSSIHRIQEAQTTICHVFWELTVAEVDRRRRRT